MDGVRITQSEDLGKALALFTESRATPHTPTHIFPVYIVTGLVVMDLIR